MSDPTTPYGSDRVPDDIQELINSAREGRAIPGVIASIPDQPPLRELVEQVIEETVEATLERDPFLDLYAAALGGLCANPNLTAVGDLLPEQLAARAYTIAEAAADRLEHDGERS